MPDLLLHHGSCGDDLNGVFSADSVKTAIFSPPYKVHEGYSPQLIAQLGANLQRILQPGAWAFMNFGQLQDDFGRPWEARQALTQGGLIPHQVIIWIKSLALDAKQRGHYQPLNSDSLLNYCWEYVFTFYKAPKSSWDRLSIGVPFSDKNNLKRATRGKNGDIHCAGDTWFIPYATTGNNKKKQHRYEYPEALVEKCLKLAGVVAGDVVFDPFVGSGRTLIVAKRVGAHGWGCELEQTVLDGARTAWYAAG